MKHFLGGYEMNLLPTPAKIDTKLSNHFRKPNTKSLYLIFIFYFGFNFQELFFTLRSGLFG